MSIQIGEALIATGLLSRGQLEHALRMQLILGGHLGTCLTELAYVSEEALARTLSKLHKMKCARAEQLDDIPLDIVKMIPREEVRSRRVVPFGVRRGSLHVAVTKPNMVTGLSASTGYKIVPYLAPEVLILRAMERYYGIRRRRRYLKVDYASLAARSARVAFGTFSANGRSDSAAVAACDAPAVDGQKGTETPCLAEHSRRMGEVQTHGELGEVILDYLNEKMQRCILFEVEGDGAGIANWRGLKFSKEKISNLVFPLDPDSIFALALDDVCFRGAVPREFDCSKFYGRLGIGVPREVLVAPIYGENRLEAVLYGDGGGHGKIAGPIDTYRLLLDEVAKVLQNLSQRQQLSPA